MKNIIVDAFTIFLLENAEEDKSSTIYEIFASIEKLDIEIKKVSKLLEK
ncbi:hypothetical protein [Metamycoplasma hominis]|uniref:Uncharacterized protein n=1 Tax=Metamycoplasma hominis TaxID=2098 RepID=A0A6A8PZ28_METHO|nr:hypothetical protein [Metamycoplasma hominis]MBD3899135.1 hypothetical protein [Metamycoplasma hominis]MCZ2781693.1 hypothetical protein [Metamycoplasma hominis]MTH75628.1 hypothetical protein [Metamycoplasma hominis]QKX37211.1 hypothetical protein HU154_01585 [Metamycoplasma hominis]QKX39988.1 hypothetical protein HU159_01510 [Metamycoplasma hominis]